MIVLGIGLAFGTAMGHSSLNQKSINLSSFSFSMSFGKTSRIYWMISLLGSPQTVSPYFLIVIVFFGYWLGFWYGDESFTLEETKELFFLTLKKLLDDNKVVLL
jgi:hypothetical protein